MEKKISKANDDFRLIIDKRSDGVYIAHEHIDELPSDYSWIKLMPIANRITLENYGNNAQMMINGELLFDTYYSGCPLFNLSFMSDLGRQIIRECETYYIGFLKISVVGFVMYGDYDEEI